jgi:hypothetical protein
MMLTEWLDSRNASLGDPSYQETFDIRNDSITSFAVSVAVIGLWFLIWLTWYRKAFGSGQPIATRLLSREVEDRCRRGVVLWEASI